MKRKLLFWLDLFVCLIWLLSMMGDRYLCFPLGRITGFLLFSLRVTFTFAMMKRERNAWLPLTLFFLVLLLGPIHAKAMWLETMSSYPLFVFGMEWDSYKVDQVMTFCRLWLWILPVVFYLVCLFMRKLSNRADVTKLDLCGALLWRDPHARTYLLLALLTLMALFAGLDAFDELRFFLCLLLPAAGVWLLGWHCGTDDPKMWPVFLAMGLFWLARFCVGGFRVILLVSSFLVMLYLGHLFYKRLRKPVLLLAVPLYLGVFFPSLIGGYNPYVCIDYLCQATPYQPYKGVYVIRDSDGTRYGLRSRYKMVVEPEYTDGISFVRTSRSDRFGGFEMYHNGYTSFYNCGDCRIHKPEGFDEVLQQKLCDFVGHYAERMKPGDDEELEITATDVMTGLDRAHLQVSFFGEPRYTYRPQNFLSCKVPPLASGEFSRTDTIMSAVRKFVFSYALDVPLDSVSLCRVYVRKGGEQRPAEAEVKRIAEQAAACVGPAN